MNILDSSQTLVVSELMIRNVARGCLESMEILNREHSSEFSTWFLPYYLLGVNALELFPKLHLIKKNINISADSKDVEKHFRKLSHKLEQIYSETNMGRSFLDKAGIQSVQKIEDKELFIFRYEFLMTSGDIVLVYHPESIRYGLLASTKSNAGYAAYQSNKLLDLCRGVADAI